MKKNAPRVSAFKESVVHSQRERWLPHSQLFSFSIARHPVTASHCIQASSRYTNLGLHRIVSLLSKITAKEKLKDA